MTSDYIEIPAAGGGSSLTDIRTSVSSSTPISMDYATANVYVSSNTGAVTYNVPGAASAHTDEWFFIKNRGTSNMTLATASSDIYYNSAVASFTVYPGEAYKIISDGTYWNVF